MYSVGAYNTVKSHNDIAYMLVLLLFAIQVPYLWLLGIASLLLIIINNWCRSALLTNGFIIKSALLILFTVTYFTQAVTFSLIEAKLASQLGFSIITLYWIGYSVKQMSVSNWPKSLEWIILVLIAGMVLFAFLCVYKSGYSFMDVFSDDYSKTSSNFWYSGQEINRPGLGALGSLGMCLLPILFFGENSKLFSKFNLCVSSIVLIGSYVCVILANRTPFLALLISFVASLLISTFKNPTSHKIRNIFLITTIVIFGFLFSKTFLSDMYLWQRFAVERLDTAGRFDSWIAMISSLFEYPNGGRVAYIAGNSFVHNLWLDVAWDSGVIPFMALLLFHLGHIKTAVNIFNSKVPANLLLLFTCTSVAFLTNFMQEPTMSASVLYFASSCFILGLMQRYSLEIKSHSVI